MKGVVLPLVLVPVDLGVAIDVVVAVDVDVDVVVVPVTVAPQRGDDRHAGPERQPGHQGRSGVIGGGGG